MSGRKPDADEPGGGHVQRTATPRNAAKQAIFQELQLLDAGGKPAALTMLRFVRAAGARLRETGSVYWRCFYSVSLTILCSAGLAFIPQGIESLRLVSQPGWNFPVFLLSLTVWSLAAWYSARLTLGRVFAGDAIVDCSDTAYVAWLRAWLPRLLEVA